MYIHESGRVYTILTVFQLILSTEFPHNTELYGLIRPLTVRADKGVGGVRRAAVGGVTTAALPSSQSTKTVCDTCTKEK